MSRELISKATRNDFREVLVGFTLHEIDMVFESGGIAPRSDYSPQLSGARRCLVEKYYVTINFCDPIDVRKVARAFGELMLQLKSRSSPWSDGGNYLETINRLTSRMEQDGFRFEEGQFLVDAKRLSPLETPALIALTEESITEHLEKAKAKIETGDLAGAITNAYTLVEEFLKEILRQTGTRFNQNEGDIKVLYSLAAIPLNLNPKGENLEGHLKTILQGLRNVIAGLYEVANKASDRHARKYKPAVHHAKLAVNSAFTLCEFMLNSLVYQKKKT
jgi:hypothetical protein